MEVLIPKRGGGYCRIELMGVVWKTVVVIINRCLREATTLHGVINGLRAGHGIGTASIKAKLLQQFTSMREKVLYGIFLDLNEAYDALERDICLEILEGHGVGPRECCLLHKSWDRLTMVDRTGSYYVTTFKK